MIHLSIIFVSAKSCENGTKSHNYVNSEGSREPVYPHSLAIAFAAHTHKTEEDKEPQLWP